MMKSTCSVGAAALFAFAGTANAQVVIDDFESYADDAALQGAWVEFADCGPVTPTLDLTNPAEGSQAMRMTYNLGVEPYFSCLRYYFDTPPDWRLFYRLEWEMRRDEPIPDDRIVVSANHDPSIVPIETTIYPQAELSTEWQTVGINLTASGTRFTDSIERLNFTPVAENAYGQGTVYVDNIRVVPLPPADVVIEDFESYTDTADLTDDWVVNSIDAGGNPNSTIALVAARLSA
jgi:hypothetical protein